MSAVRHPLVVLDAAFKVQSANAAFYKVFQVDPKDIKNQLFHQINGRQWDDRRLLAAIDEMVARKSQIDDFEITQTIAGGGERTFLLSGRIIPAQNQGSDLILLAIEDITQRRQTRKELEALNQALARRTAEAEERAEELARSEQTLRDQKRILQAVLDSTGDGIFVADMQGRLVIINPAARKMAGPVPPDIEPDKWQQHYGVFQRDQATPLPVEQFPLFRAIQGEDVGETEYFLKNQAWPQGFWVSASASPLHDETGGVIGGVVTVRDINFRKEAEEAVRRSESRLRAIVETAYDAIITFDERSIVESCNAAAERIFGYTARELIGQPLTVLMESPSREQFEVEMTGFRKTGKEPRKGTSRELLARRRDGSTFPIDLSVSEFHHGAGRLFTGIFRDVSERRAFQEKLLSIAEEEQRRIGQDLHDDIGQELTGLALKAETLAEIIDLDKTPDKAIARGIVADLDRTRKKLRLLARGLVPVEVDSKGLTAALLDLTARLGELNGVSCVLECQESALVEDSRVATQLYHIAQEAIANAIKHGQARTIKVLLEAQKQDQARDQGRWQGTAQEAQTWSGNGVADHVIPGWIARW